MEITRNGCTPEDNELKRIFIQQLQEIITVNGSYDAIAPEEMYRKRMSTAKVVMG